MPYSLQRAIAATVLVVLSPLLCVLAGLLAIRQGRPILYVGTRVGRSGATFEQLKFRTMVRNADQLLDGDGLTGDAPVGRITPLGQALRRYSLDELPQLVNVVRGDMALIGPRPLLEEVADRVEPDHARYSVLPGLTGLAQISGRNTLPWSQRLELDAQYVANRSIRLDVNILVRSVSVVLGGDGFVADRNASQSIDI